MVLLRSVAALLYAFLSLPAQAQEDCYYNFHWGKVDTVNKNFFAEQLSKGSFEIFRDKKAIPKFVLTQFSCFNLRDTLFANPDEEFSSGCMVIDGVPRRQLVLYARRNDIHVIVYKAGGIVLSGNAVYMSFERSKDIDGNTHKLSSFYAGYSPEYINCKTIDDVYDALADDD